MSSPSSKVLSTTGPVLEVERNGRRLVSNSSMSGSRTPRALALLKTILQRPLAVSRIAS